MSPETTQVSAVSLRRDSGLACLSLVAQFHGVFTDPVQLVTRLVPTTKPRDFTELHRAAGLVGLKTRRVAKRFEQLQTTPLQTGNSSSSQKRTNSVS